METSLEEVSFTARYELMLRNGLEKFRNLPKISLAARTACLSAYRIGSPSPRYLNHVVLINFLGTRAGPIYLTNSSSPPAS